MRIGMINEQDFGQMKIAKPIKLTEAIKSAAREHLHALIGGAIFFVLLLPDVELKNVGFCFLLIDQFNRSAEYLLFFPLQVIHFFLKKIKI